VGVGEPVYLGVVNRFENLALVRSCRSVLALKECSKVGARLQQDMRAEGYKQNRIDLGLKSRDTTIHVVDITCAAGDNWNEPGVILRRLCILCRALRKSEPERQDRCDQRVLFRIR